MYWRLWIVGILLGTVCGQTVPALADGPTPSAVKSLSVGASDTLRAHYLVTVADDFIVDAYLNGRHIPDSKRVLLNETFGATVERINIDVHQGDWLVFNVVNNRQRWGGAYYFAVAGCLAPNQYGFVSRLDNSAWSACDTPGDAESFISIKTYLQLRPALAVSRPWGAGRALMQQNAGNSWDGVPLWGSARNTWIKVIVD